MANGTVKNTISGRNFGFIVEDLSRKEYFFHKDDFNGFWDDLIKDVSKNTIIPVVFEIAESNKGPRAANVRRLDYPNEG